MGELGSADIFEFARFRFDRRGHCLYRVDKAGDPVLLPTGRTALDILGLLVERAGEVVESEVIRRTVWRGKTVEDANLATQIFHLRESIGRERIQSVSGRGYRFVGPVTRCNGDGRSIKPEMPQNAVPSPPRLSIVVLPFTDLSEDQTRQYFVDGITEDLTTDLSRLPDLFVIARNTAFAYRDQPVDIKQIGRDLGVRYVLEGSIRRAGSRVRLNAQLIDAERGAHVWGQRFDAQFTDLFEVQDEITSGIVGAIEPQLLKFERDRIGSRPQPSENAYEFYQRGMWHLYKYCREDDVEAQACFRRALAIDPQYPHATAFLAISVCNAAYLGWAKDAERNYAEAYKLAERAVDLDPRYPPAHFALGLVCMWTSRSDRAMAALQEAINLNPSYAAPHVLLGQMYLYRGQPEEALGLAQRGIRLSPRDPRLFMWLPALAGAHYQRRHYGESVEIGRRSWNLNRNWPAGLRYVVACLAQLGRIEEARAALEDLRPFDTDLAFVEGLLLRLYKDRGPVDHFLDGLRKASFE
jgi:TolB-like protein/tetratricopeptide (TPR) repeat protein